MDVEDLLKSLKEHKVRFVVIGATAFPVHGYSRATLDIDLFIEPSEANARRTHEALKSFGYARINRLDLFEQLAPGVIVPEIVIKLEP